MMRMMFSIFFALVSTFLNAQEIHWETNYNQALKLSADQKKPLLIFFTGSDWSGLSMKMKNEVLNGANFQKAVSDRFVCVEIDFPKHHAFSSENEQLNNQVKEKFHISELPLLLIIDETEREITRMGFVPKNEVQLAQDLTWAVEQDAQLRNEMQSLNRTSSNLRRLYYVATELQNHAAIETLLSAGVENEDAFFLLEKYRLMVENGERETKEIVQVREKLLKNDSPETQFTLALIDFQDLSKHAHEIKERKSIIKPLEEYLTKYGEKDFENKWRIEMMIAQFYVESDEWNDALIHAETAFQNAPETMKEEIQNSLSYIRGQLSQTAQR